MIDPWGKIIGEGLKYAEDVPVNESVIIVNIDDGFISKVRKEMPVLQHRRDDIYNLTENNNKLVLPECRQAYMFADKIIHPSTVFYCTKYSFAFTNIRCVVPGRILSAI